MTTPDDRAARAANFADRMGTMVVVSEGLASEEDLICAGLDPEVIHAQRALDDANAALLALRAGDDS